MPSNVEQIREEYERRFDQAEAPVDPAADEVFRRLLSYLPEDRATRVLDAGSGSGRYANALVARGYRDVHGIDLVRASQLPQAPAFRYLRADVCALPFAAQTFDFVYSSSVIYYASDLGRALGELRRVLRPGGLLFFTGHTLHSFFTLSRRVRRRLGLASAAHLAHARFRPTNQYRDALRRVGFELVLQDGYRLLPHSARLARTLARLQLAPDSPAVPRAIRVLRSHIAYHFIFVARRSLEPAR